MKSFFDFLKTRKLAYASFIILLVIYFVMIFAEFFAPYPATLTFEKNTYHPANIRMSTKGLKVRECRTLDKATWKYAMVKDQEYIHDFKWFAKGYEYRLFGVIPCDRHLFGCESKDGEQIYPAYLLGADNLGRDLFSRIVYGSRISLTIGFVATAVSLLLAVLLGGISGYFGGAADWTIMRFAEFFMLIPDLYFILFLRSLLNTKMDSGASYMIITLILALVGWPGMARTVRGMVHAIKREEFVMDADLEGIPKVVIIFRHIIPQMASLLIVSTALAVPGFIMSETTLSYLGLGINDPAVSWGSLINRDISTLNNLRNFPWLLWPVFMLLVVTLAFNFIGDALRDFYDPYAAVFKKRRNRAVNKKKENEGEMAGAPDDTGGPDTAGAFDAGGAPESAPDTASAIAATGAPDTASAPDDASALNAGGSPESALAATGAPSITSAPCAPGAPSSAGNAPLLSVQDLRVTFTILRGTHAVKVYGVRGVSFDVNRGEILGLVGESGSGKSVSTTAVPGLFSPNAEASGRIIYNGTDLMTLNQKQLRKYRGSEIALIFQEPGRSFDPLQNIGSVFHETLKNQNPQISKEEAVARTVRLLRDVGLPDAENRLSAFPHQFSGGQLQRIGIALALAQDCKLLIADEPTTALDVTIQAQIVSLLLRLKEERGLSIIFISHNINLVGQISDRIAVMYGGKIMETGTAEQIMKAPRHPYTKALVGALPEFGTHYTQKQMESIPGRVSDPADPPEGCPFAPRCSYAEACCLENDCSCYKMKE